MSSQPRILLIAEACNPEWTSVPLVGWNWYRHLHPHADITLVTHVRNRDALLRHAPAPEQIVFIDNERLARPMYKLGRVLTLGRGLGWTTQQALMWLPYLYFEKLVYRRFKDDLRQRRFDVVHRLTPLSPTYASPLASWLDVPLMLGPLNGGLPWPKGTTKTRLAEMEFLSYVRRAYQHLPYVRNTYRRAAAVVVGSRHTQRELEAAFGIQCQYMPENGIDPGVFHANGRKPMTAIRPFRILFVGRLVPYKGADVVIEAFAGSETLRRNAEVVIIGDGPQRAELEALVQRHQLTERVQFRGALPQAAVADELRSASVFAFPSIREFGGAVVMEALACGLPSIVVDHGGPSEYVTPDIGAVIPVGTRDERVAALRNALNGLAERDLTAMSAAASAASHVYLWEEKARELVRAYASIAS